MVLIMCSGTAGAACTDIGDRTERLSCYDEAVRCGAIRNDDDRLACFDREIAGGVAGPGSGQSSSGEAAGMPPRERRSTPPPADFRGSPAPASAPAPDVFEDDFGRPKQEPDRIESQLVGTFDGWEGSERFELANGQVWENRRPNTVRSYRAIENPDVVVRKNMFGFYVLEIPEAGATVPVRRVQ